VQGAPKHHVKVGGTRGIWGRKPAIMTAEVKQGKGVLRRHDAQSVPLWSGWRRREARSARHTGDDRRSLYMGGYQEDALMPPILFRRNTYAG